MGLSRSKHAPRRGEEQRKAHAGSVPEPKDKLAEQRPQEARPAEREGEKPADPGPGADAAKHLLPPSASGEGNWFMRCSVGSKAANQYEHITVFLRERACEPVQSEECPLHRAVRGPKGRSPGCSSGCLGGRPGALLLLYVVTFDRLGGSQVLPIPCNLNKFRNVWGTSEVYTPRPF
ncbi:spermatogenesis-associated protein 33 isoform X1 [Lemur catta]|uniref:spermatogenesis-associated protein 33 isoform X1 n=1 Tax=Lemur catta TaxID=9447 RepID=UPI001E26D145|nr:spermatogenesis-associated protein 33 isoform X1 [Lemur catta]